MAVSADSADPYATRGRRVEGRGAPAATTACEPAPTRRGRALWRSDIVVSGDAAAAAAGARRPSSPCSPACATTRRGRPRPAACPRTATTATSSGTPRPGCTRRLLATEPGDRARRACSTGSTGCRPRVPVRGRDRLVGRAVPVGERVLRRRGHADVGEHRPVRDPRQRRRRRWRMWQYWLATGDRSWLATKGWPVLKGIADFWVSRASRNSDGSYSINTVIPPDEYVEQVDDSVYTNVAARDALRFATQAAALVGPAAVADAGPGWPTGCGSCSTATLGIHPEYAGLPGRRGQAGRRDAAGLPLGEPAAGRGDRRPTSTTTCRAPTPADRR